MENSRFSKMMAEKSDSELIFYIENQDKFQDEAVIAAQNEINKRLIKGDSSYILDEAPIIEKKANFESIENKKDSFGIPKNISKASRVIVIILLLSLVYTFFLEQFLGVKINFSISQKIMIGILSMIYFILVFFLRIGFNWSRYALTIFLSIELFISAPKKFLILVHEIPLFAFFYFIILSLIIYSITLMFSPENKYYYQNKRKKEIKYDTL